MMHSLTVRGFFLLLPLLSAGCASLSEDGCREAATKGWGPVGFNDGRQGENIEARLVAHREACEKLGIRPDPASYKAGWQRGIRDYCTIQNAYSMGVAGRAMQPDLCHGVGDGSVLVLANHRIGMQVHDIKEDIRRMESDIADLEHRLRDKNLSPEAQRELRSQIRRRNNDLSNMRPMLYDAQSRPLVTSQ